MHGRELLESVLPKQVGRIVPKPLGVLDEAPAVDVAHVRVAIRAQQVEAAQSLAEGEHHRARDRLLRRREDDRIALLEPPHVAHDLAVDHRRLACLRVRVFAPDGVHLDIGALGLQELLVDVRVAVANARLVLVGIVLRRTVRHLAKESLAPAAL